MRVGTDKIAERVLLGIRHMGESKGVVVCGYMGESKGVVVCG